MNIDPMGVEVRTPASELMAPSASRPAIGCRADRGARRLGQKLLQGLVLATLVCASYLLTSRFFLASVEVVGPSMMPCLHDSEHFLLNRWIFYFRMPRAGEIVVFHDPTDYQLAVKRVIGVPGDRVDFKQDRVYLNGQALTEPYLPRGTPTYPYLGRKSQSFTCGEGEYLLLGDNRKDSADSRTYGLILRKAILGRLVR